MHARSHDRLLAAAALAVVATLAGAQSTIARTPHRVAQVGEVVARGREVARDVARRGPVAGHDDGRRERDQ
ncbi:MAG: hypothetical protein ACHQJ7_02115, partial [Vicinamibacteria bacterium]